MPYRSGPSPFADSVEPWIKEDTKRALEEATRGVNQCIRGEIAISR